MTHETETNAIMDSALSEPEISVDLTFSPCGHRSPACQPSGETQVTASHQQQTACPPDAGEATPRLKHGLIFHPGVQMGPFETQSDS